MNFVSIQTFRFSEAKAREIEIEKKRRFLEFLFWLKYCQWIVQHRSLFLRFIAICRERERKKKMFLRFRRFSSHLVKWPTISRFNHFVAWLDSANSEMTSQLEKSILQRPLSTPLKFRYRDPTNSHRIDAVSKSLQDDQLAWVKSRTMAKIKLPKSAFTKRMKDSGIF